jgi:septal ring factor EnvC (AmiA/AmiB activator)
MNVPNISSDNLYKFLALASLVTLLVLTYFIKKAEFELSDEEVNFIGELKTEVLKSDDLEKQLESDIDIRTQLITELKQLSENMSKGSIQNRTLSERIKVLKNQSSTLSKSIDDLEKGLKLLHAKNETTKSLIENKRIFKEYLTWIYSYSSIILIVLTLVGFYLWYQKVQKYQDRILKIQAKEIQQVSKSSVGEN